MPHLVDIASLERNPRRVALEGAEAEQFNESFRLTPETLERIRQFEEAFAVAAFQCRNILVG